jgi:hypothetical protein
MVSPSALVDAAREAGLGLIAVTDHDTMKGVDEAVRRGHEIGIEVVAGQEITTSWPAQTHVVGWFLESPVASNRSLEYTVRAIQDQGGLAIIPHPFMPTYFASCQPRMLSRLLDGVLVDGIETMFTAPIGRRRRLELGRFYERYRDRLGSSIGATDSHFGRYDIGRAVTEYPGRTAADFRQAVLDRTTLPRRRLTDLRPPVSMLARQQVSSLVRLPWLRITGQL